jgi:uncharacterized protein YegJ (DUF2314 family)
LRYLAIAFIVLCVIALCLFADPPRSVSERAEGGETFNVQEDDPLMLQAMDRARSSLEQFLAKAKKPDVDTDGYAVKVGIPAGRVTEYFWVNDFAMTGENFSGKIDNEPRYTTLVKRGQIYSFRREQIVDWTYLDVKAHKMYGNFTACALLGKESPADAEEFKQRYGLECS